VAAPLASVEASAADSEDAGVEATVVAVVGVVVLAAVTRKRNGSL
jgi:hypothetical protein